MIPYPDLTEAELAVRKLLERKRSDFEKTDTPFANWARETREAWLLSPAGERALSHLEARRAAARARGRSGK